MGTARPRVPARAVVVVASVLAVIAVLAGHGLLGVLGAVVAVAVVFGQRWTLLHGLLSGAAAVMVALVAVACLAEISGWHLDEQRSARLALVAVVVALAVASWSVTRGRTVLLLDARTVVALVPAAIVVGAFCALSDASTFSWYAQSGDGVSHAAIVRSLRDEGSTRYLEPWAFEGYPVGIHAVAALTGRADTGGRDTRGVILRTARLTAIMYALLVAASCLLVDALLRAPPTRGRRVGRRVGRRPTLAGVGFGVAVVGVLLVADWTAVFTLGFGFLGTAVAGWLIAGAVLAAVAHRDRPLLAVAAGCVFAAAMAHTFQLLVPMVAVAFVPALVAVVRARRIGPAVGLMTGAALLGGVPMWSALRFVGLEHAEIGGAIAAVPMVLAAVLVVGAVGTAVAGARRDRALALAAGLPVVAGIALTVWTAMRTGWSDGSLAYYPRKVAWHTAVLALPIAVAGIVVGLDSLLRGLRSRRDASLVFLGGAVLVPVAVLGRGWATDSRMLLDGRWGPSPAVAAQGLEAAAWMDRQPAGASAWVVGSPFGYHDAQLTAFLTTVPGRPSPSHAEVASVDATAVCADLARHPGSVVFDLGTILGLTHAGCSPPTEIVRWGPAAEP